jgi:hypothetical protein
MLQMDIKKKIVPIHKSELILSAIECGPSFGFRDLYIVDECNRRNENYSVFPLTYNYEGSKDLVISHASINKFCGVTFGKESNSD